MSPRPPQKCTRRIHQHLFGSEERKKDRGRLHLRRSCARSSGSGTAGAGPGDDPAPCACYGREMRHTRAERNMLPKGSPHAVQPCLAHSFIRPSELRNLPFRGADLTGTYVYPPLENEKSFISGGSSPGTGPETAPRKRKIFRLVGQLAWNRAETAPRKRKIFHLVGQFAWNRAETAPPKMENRLFRG